MPTLVSCVETGALPIFLWLPVSTHEVEDQQSFRMITSQLYVNGSATQAEICRAFGVSPISVKRSVKLYRKKGIASFFEEPRRRGAAVLIPEVLQEVQGLLDQGLEIPEVANSQGFLADTLRKALRAGKIHKPIKQDENSDDDLPLASSKSERSSIDAAAPNRDGCH